MVVVVKSTHHAVRANNKRVSAGNPVAFLLNDVLNLVHRAQSHMIQKQ
jgi:hypothetical protein